MNIWMLNHYAVPQQYYYLTRSYHFAKNLIEAGHSVTIFAASSVHNSDINLITDGSPYIELQVDGLTYVLFYGRQYQGSGKDRVINHIDVALKMWKYCPRLTEEYGLPDVIYASAGQSLTLVAGIFIAKKMEIRCLSEVTDLWPESFVAYGLISKKNPLLKLLYAGEKWIYKKSDALIFSMEGGKDYIIEKGWDTEHGGPVDLNKVYHINNGVDLEAFDYNKEHYTIDDPDLDDPDTFKVVYTGSIRKANRSIMILPEVAKEIADRGRENIKILVYGKGDYASELVQSCEKNSIRNLIYKGFVNKKEVPYVLSKSDVNILNCDKSEIGKYGSSQNKLFEYLAIGKPILSGESDRYSIIKNQNCGISKQFQNAGEIAEALIRFAEMPREEYDFYCSNARRVALDYDFNALTEKLLKIVEGEKCEFAI